MEDYPMNTNELVEAMVQRLGTEVKRLLEQVQAGQVPAGAVEGVVRQRLWQFGRQAVAVLLEALDQNLVESQPVHDRRTRTVVTLFGPIDVSRSRCQDGRYPMDEALGLVDQQGWTVAVQEAVCLLSCECSFETSSDLMGRLLGLSVSAPSIQQISRQTGQRGVEVRQEQSACAVSCEQGLHKQQQRGGTLVVAIDGCQAPRRDGWHEVKVATVYRNESRCRKASGRGQVLQKEYVASVEKAEGFGRRLWDVVLIWGIEQVHRLVCMGDGAIWIWNLAAEHFPGAIEIVDFYHALESACGGWQVGEALWGDRQRSERTRGWVHHYRKQLRRGRVDLVIAAIERGQERLKDILSAEGADVVRRNLEYFRSNRGRMDYARYRQMGLSIGTGIVEGSCKFVVQSRFKRPGSRWSEDGLRWLLALKLMRLNNRWELLWPHLKAA
jgi:hypothetical protein